MGVTSKASCPVTDGYGGNRAEARIQPVGAVASASSRFCPPRASPESTPSINLCPGSLWQALPLEAHPRTSVAEGEPYGPQILSEPRKPCSGGPPCCSGPASTPRCAGLRSRPLLLNLPSFPSLHDQLLVSPRLFNMQLSHLGLRWGGAESRWEGSVCSLVQGEATARVGLCSVVPVACRPFSSQLCCGH